MPLSPNEIRSRAIAFAREWKAESSEDAEAKSFWDGFFNVFGISRRHIASFERPVKKSDGKGGYIDLLWKGMLLVEHKSRGLDLDRAYAQATDYFYGLKDRDLPRYVIVSDFAHFRLYDLESDASETNPVEFPLAELHKNTGQFGFISGYQSRSYSPQRAVDVEAAEELGLLHDLLRDAEYTGHPLEVFLVRVLFCLFAEDNGIFEAQQFRDWIEQRTHEDGSDLGPQLSHLFQVLNTEKRPSGLDDQLAAFRYINGRLFDESIPIASLNQPMRNKLLECARIDWSKVSPAIFGALFQSIMNKKARRNLGAHYTSEANILKALEPLLLDDLRAEFARVRRDSKRLGDFHEKLANIRILDPACGCGNFLVVAYRELRVLELEVLKALFPEPREQQLDISPLVLVDVDQFYGIEIEEFPAQIAQVAMWMTDHQMNLEVSKEFGAYFARLPLKKSPTVVYGPDKGNALRIDWRTVAPVQQLSYIVGNPPFIGKHLQSKVQKRDMEIALEGIRGKKSLDYVAGWFRKAADLMRERPAIQTAFVATNSVTQGEQVGALWPYLLRSGVKIAFAHRTFRWTNEARGRAAVHCVIIGFGTKEPSVRILYEYENVRSQAQRKVVANISPYLVDSNDIVLLNRSTQISGAMPILYGSKAADGGRGSEDGNLIFNDETRHRLVLGEPTAAKWIRRFVGADEFLYDAYRFCLWLKSASANELRAMPEVMKVLQRVKVARASSTKKQTQDLAKYPSLFAEDRQPDSNYLLIPGHTSELRHYVPFAYLTPDVICGNANFLVVGAEAYEFGVLSSLMHMTWIRAVCGRLESRYRYSAGIVYNNFPWPKTTAKQKSAIETAAQAVLDERTRHPGSTLADLYDPLSMPPGLVKAHATLDRAVDAA